MLASIANGTSHIRGLLQGEDVLRTIDAFRALGVAIEGPDAGAITVSGVGPAGLVPSERPIDLGNSGTAMRLKVANRAPATPAKPPDRIKQ